MIQPIGTARVQGISLGTAQESSGRPVDHASAAMSTLSGRISATLAGELGLVQGGGPRTHAGTTAGDPYGVAALAGDLATKLNASPSDAGRLARALHDFAGEVASLVGARPQSSVFEMLRDLQFNLTDPDRRAGMSDSDVAIAAIVDGVFRIRDYSPWTPLR